MSVFKFTARIGMSKPSFHVIDRVEFYMPEVEHQVLIPSQDAILAGMVKVLNENEKHIEYWTQHPFAVVSVSQTGHLKPTYNTRFIIKLGGEQVIRVNTFGKPGPLFFEADGELMNVGEQFKRQLEFACLTNKTAPQSISKNLIVTRQKGFLPNEGRGISVIKQI
jgi:hypothetical protein